MIKNACHLPHKPDNLSSIPRTSQLPIFGCHTVLTVALSAHSHPCSVLSSPTTLIKHFLNGRKQSFPWSPWVLYLELFQITKAATADSHRQWTAGWCPQREVSAFSYHLHTRPQMCEHTHKCFYLASDAITISLRPGKEWRPQRFWK